jgi:hypothetical protein
MTMVIVRRSSGSARWRQPRRSRTRPAARRHRRGRGTERPLVCASDDLLVSVRVICTGTRPTSESHRWPPKVDAAFGSPEELTAFGLIYSADAEADRAFLRDVLEYPHVDAGAGWLIFKLPASEIAVHPIDGPPLHELYLMCDDLDAAMAQLTAKGATFAAVTEARWGG